MKRLALFGVLVCLCSENASGQASKGSFAGTSYTLGGLCETPFEDPTASCPNAYWLITDSTGNHIDYDGNVSSMAHDEYGLLQASGTATVTCHQACAAGSVASGAGGQASFVDSLNFPGLSGSKPYYLMVTVTVVGDVAGGFLRGTSSVELNAEVNLVDVTTANLSNCVIQNSDLPQGVFRQTCSTMMRIFPGDVVTLSGLLGLGVNAVAPNSTDAITQNPQADFSSNRNYGATFALSVVGAKGKKVSKAEGVIVAASGTTYPTH
jgi:hypothetical protein